MEAQAKRSGIKWWSISRMMKMPLIFLFCRSDKNFIDEMERIYKNASVYADGCIISFSDFHNLGL